MRNSIRKLLLFSQQYTRTDMTYLTKGGFWLILSYSIQVGTGIITTVALANLLPKETLGTYQFILSIAAILSVLTLSGLGTAITRAVAQGNDGALRAGVRTKLKWSIGIVLSSGMVSLYYYLNDNSTLAIAFLIVGTFAPLIESFKLYNDFLYGKESFRDNVLLGAWRKPLPLVAILITIYFTSNVLTLIFVYFVSHTISSLAVYFTVIRKYKPSSATNDRETLTLSKHLSVLRIAGQVGSHADKILIWHFLGAVSVASFAIAQLATRYSGGLLNTLSGLVLPKISKRDLPTLQQTLPRKVWLFTGLMTLGTATFIIIIPFIFPLLFPEYSESIAIAQVLALGLILIPRSVYTKVLIAHRQTQAQYILGIGTPIIRITLLLLLIPQFGIWGAVYAILATDIISAVAVKYFFTVAESSEPSAELAEFPDRDV